MIDTAGPTEGCWTPVSPGCTPYEDEAIIQEEDEDEEEDPFPTTVSFELFPPEEYPEEDE